MSLFFIFSYFFFSCFLLGIFCIFIFRSININFNSLFDLKLNIAAAPGEAFGYFHKMHSFHLQHYILFWLLICVSFGIVGTIWYINFKNKRKMVYFFSGLFVIPLSILIASIPGSMLWAYFKLHSSGQTQGLWDSLVFMIEWIPTGIVLAFPLYLISFPFNIVITILGYIVIFSKKIQNIFYVHS